jgi:hypothetical protein
MYFDIFYNFWRHLSVIEIVRKYLALRPNHTDNERFFSDTEMAFGAMPENIAASFLKLPSPKKYTRHCFRR